MVLFSVGCDSPPTTACSINRYFSVFAIIDISCRRKTLLPTLVHRVTKGFFAFLCYLSCSDPTETVGDLSKNTKVKTSHGRSHIVYTGHVSHVQGFNWWLCVFMLAVLACQAGVQMVCYTRSVSWPRNAVP